MDEEKTVKVLEEIRDLQAKHYAAYLEAAERQKEAIELSKKSIQAARKVPWLLVIAFILLLFATFLLKQG